MATLRFYLKPLSNGTAQIMAVFQDGVICPTKYLGYTIPGTKIGEAYKHWNKGKVRGLDNADLINKRITDWQNAFDSYIDNCNLTYTAPDMKHFITTLTGTVSMAKHLGKGNQLNQIVEQYLQSVKTEIATRTQDAYRVICTDLTDYQAKTKRILLLTDIDKNFYRSFTDFLITERGNYNKTINRKMRRIITIMNYAIEELKVKDYNPEYAKRKALKEAEAPKFPLRPEELASLWAYKPDKDYLTIVLDAFLLACETGLRKSDVLQLRPSHIKSHVIESGLIQYIDVTAIKTSKGTDMPLSDRALLIIGKYTNIANKPLFKFKKRPAAHKDEDNGDDTILEEIFKTLELNRQCEVVMMQGANTTRSMHPLHDVITFHTARNTYITRLLANGVAPVHVMDSVGHSDLKTTMGYFRGDDVSRWQSIRGALNDMNKG